MPGINRYPVIATVLYVMTIPFAKGGDFIYKPVWNVDDETAIAGSVAIGDDGDIWGAWRLQGARLSLYPADGDGTPEFEFVSLGDGSRGGVAAAKGADRVLFLESSNANDEYWLHAFTSQSNGVPDWSFEFPEEMSGLEINFRHVAVSHDGSTAAAVVRDGSAFQFVLYIFDADTGDVVLTWNDAGVMTAVDLADDGSRVLLTQWNRATVIDTGDGDTVFQTAGSGSGGLNYRMSGNGEVIVVGGNRLVVYQLDGGIYEPVIDYTEADSWFGLASVVSRDGSTVGTLRSNDAARVTEAIFFDVDSREILGAHLFSGTGDYTPAAQHAASSDDGSVMAFASWGTENQDWPEIMVFNRDAELIGAIEFSGSAFSVDVSGDGRQVVGGSKAVHANVTGNGGGIQVIAREEPGTPEPPVLEATPEELHFGDVVVGTFESAEITIHNAAEPGAASVLVSSIQFAGAVEFTDTGNGTCEAGVTELEAGQNCTIEVSFTPSGEGEFAGGVLVEGGGKSASVSLSGGGFDPGDDIFLDRFEQP